MLLNTNLNTRTASTENWCHCISMLKYWELVMFAINEKERTYLHMLHNSCKNNSMHLTIGKKLIYATCNRSNSLCKLNHEVNYKLIQNLHIYVYELELFIFITYFPVIPLTSCVLFPVGLSYLMRHFKQVF